MSGPDPSCLHKLADSVKTIMEESNCVSSITTDWEPSRPVLEIDYDQSLARTKGLSRKDVSLSVLSATSGIPSGSFYQGLHKNTIYLKSSEQNGGKIDNLEEVPLFSVVPNFESILNETTLLKMSFGKLNRTDIVKSMTETSPVKQIGQGVETSWEDVVIPRYNTQRSQTVMCSPKSGMETEKARKMLAQKIEKIQLPQGYTLQWKGEKEASTQTMKYLFKNVPLGIVLIIAILILLMKDYKKPAIILCCVPLLAVGIVAAMLITGKTFTICAIVGALGLVGMMIKNCIVLMDSIEMGMQTSQDKTEVLIAASESRFRPVMMASLTTILGMIPLLNDAMFGPMAVTIMGGLFFSVFTTLFVVPVLYALFFNITNKREER